MGRAEDGPSRAGGALEGAVSRKDRASQVVMREGCSGLPLPGKPTRGGGTELRLRHWSTVSFSVFSRRVPAQQGLRGLSDSLDWPKSACVAAAGGGLVISFFPHN